jgi:hypothetical protein
LDVLGPAQIADLTDGKDPSLALYANLLRHSDPSTFIKDIGEIERNVGSAWIGRTASTKCIRRR